MSVVLEVTYYVVSAPLVLTHIIMEIVDLLSFL